MGHDTFRSKDSSLGRNKLLAVIRRNPFITVITSQGYWDNLPKQCNSTKGVVQVYWGWKQPHKAVVEKSGSEKWWPGWT